MPCNSGQRPDNVRIESGMTRICLERLPLGAYSLLLFGTKRVKLFPELLSSLKLVAHVFGGGLLRATSSLTTRPCLKSSRERRNSTGANRLRISAPIKVAVAFNSWTDASLSFAFGFGSATGTKYHRRII